MRLGDVANPDAVGAGKPLDGVRVLALEQMQALPYATQLLARLGAEVVKVENPSGGDLGRGSQPAMTDPEGRSVGATFLRNNLDKRSICIDLKSPAGRDLVLGLAPAFDVIAENSKAGAMARLGLGYADIAAVHPRAIYLSVSGFGNTVPSPYDAWPAFAPIVEAMSGIYEFRRSGDDPPVVAPVGALGDIGSALYAVIGVLAALRHRDATGSGQHVDIAMLDAMVAMTDLVTNFWSLGLRDGAAAPLIMHGFRASDGWFIIQVGREPQFATLAELVGRARLAHRPPVRHATGLGRAPRRRHPSRRRGLGREPDPPRGLRGDDGGRDRGRALLPRRGGRPRPARRGAQHAGRGPRTDGVDEPVLVPGNPVKMTQRGRGPRDPRAVARRAHRRGPGRRARPRRRPRWPQLRTDGVIA